MKYTAIFKNSIVILMMLGISLFAEVSNKNGTTAAQFLKIGVGARPMAMGGAYVAAVNDAYSLYWNPAAITKLDKISVVGTYTSWFADIKHQFLGFVIPIDEKSGVGFQATFLNMDDMEITTVENPHGTGEFFEAYDIALGVSYGIRLTEFFSVGITGKYIEQTIYNESASTFAFDVGSLLEIPFHGLKLGMRMANFGGKMQLDGRDLTREFDMNPNNTFNVGVESRLKTEPWELPVVFQVGVAMDVVGGGDSFYKSELNRVTLSVDGSHPTESPEFVSFGLEYEYDELIALRSGYRLNRDVEKMFYGIGLNI
ncbi:PorV/PorQ family protein, partial [Calditrichota bacterium]